MTLTQILLRIAVGAALGGLVGYLTNRIAVWMLFNPRRALSWHRHRLPLTPGLVVEKQAELAHAIGETVGRELVNPEAVTDRIRDEETSSELAENVSAIIEDIAARDLPSIAELAEPRYTAHIEDMREPFRRKLRDSIGAFLRGPQTRRMLLELVESGCERLAERPLQRWLTTDRRESLAAWLIERLREHLSSEGVDELLSETAHSLTSGLTEAESEEFAAIKAHVIEILNRRAPDMADTVLEYLRGRLSQARTQYQIRQFLIERSHSISQNILHRYLSPTSIPGSYLSTRGITAKLIRDHWPLIQQQMMQELQSEETRQLTADGIRDLAAHIAEMPGERLIGAGGKRELAAMVQSTIRTFLTSRINYESIQQALYEWLTEQGRRPLEAFVPNWRDLTRKRAEQLIEDVPDVLEEPRWRETVDNVLDRLFDVLIHQTPLGRPADWIPPERRDALSRAVARHLHEQAVAAVPRVLEHVNVPALVEQQINKLDPTSIERTVRKVSERELRAIIWFGGLAGIIVGGIVQPLLSLILS